MDRTHTLKMIKHLEAALKSLQMAYKAAEPTAPIEMSYDQRLDISGQISAVSADIARIEAQLKEVVYKP